MGATIRKLDKSTISRIAAGEIIHSPSHVVKELLENAIDAGSTAVSIAVRDGGKSRIVVEDNGSGIHKEDLDIICHRFTTSKLVEIEDLYRLSSYGFRGEAMASISQVSHLSIYTKTSDTNIGHEAKYHNGELVSLNSCGRSTGTRIVVENLFYNSLGHSRLLKSSGDEFNRVLDVVSKYCINRAGTAISLTKEGHRTSSICSRSGAKIVDNIRLVYGEEIARELKHVSHAGKLANIEAYATGSGYGSSKFILVIFVNNRLVELEKFRTAIRFFYSTILPVKTFPFVYLDIHVEPNLVDVNVHSTKNWVLLSNEAAIVDLVVQLIKEKIAETSSKTFVCGEKRDQRTALSPIQAHRGHVKKQAWSIVRTDARSRTLLSFGDKYSEPDNPRPKLFSPMEFPDSRSKIQILCDERHRSAHTNVKPRIYSDQGSELVKLLKNHTFVGLADPFSMLVQHETYLWMINCRPLLFALYHETILNRLYHFSPSHVEPPVDLLAVWDKDLSETAFRNQKVLLNCFSIGIENKTLVLFPWLFGNPNVDCVSELKGLVSAILSLENGDNEKLWLGQIPPLLAHFYCSIDEKRELGDMAMHMKKCASLVVDIGFPDSGMGLDKLGRILTDTRTLYKGFERC